MTTTLRDAARAALSILENEWTTDGGEFCRYCGCAINERHQCELVLTCDALSSALAHPAPAQTPLMADAAEMLWIVLANVSGGDWSKQTPEWQEACIRWRDYYFAARNAPAQTPMSEEELERLAVGDEFLLYCSQDDFNEIARAVECHHGIRGKE